MRIRLTETGWMMLAVLGFTMTGCHSAYVEADVVNETGAPLSLVEVDYPSASFGTQALAPHAVYHYRFKVQGEGPLKVLWTDERHVDHTGTGPVVHEGAEGTLRVAITTGGTVDWNVRFKQ